MQVDPDREENRNYPERVFTPTPAFLKQKKLEQKKEVRENLRPDRAKSHPERDAEQDEQCDTAPGSQAAPAEMSI